MMSILTNKSLESIRDIRRAASCGLAVSDPASREPQSLIDSNDLVL